MINMNAKEAEELVNMIEWFVENENNEKISVDMVMKKFDITFDQYRLLCQLSMPCIRSKDELQTAKSRASYFKGIYNRERHERERLESFVNLVRDFIKSYFHEHPAVEEYPAETPEVDAGNAEVSDTNPDVNPDITLEEKQSA